MPNIYISLDLETTGFDANNDQVIEIAAIKFEDDHILETFETLVNPGVEIPAMVSHITGISAEQVKDAPSFDQISDNLSKFIGGFPIVGHNISFDLNFLEAKGIPILNKQFDTLILSSILLPNLPSYSLDTISRQLKLEHTQKHRAMSDANVCFQLFQILMEKISLLPSKTLKEIQHQISKLDWDLGELFSIPSAAPKKPNKNKTAIFKKTEKKVEIEPKNKEELLELLNANSPLKTLVKDYESRPSQVKLLSKIIDAFGHNYHLIAEAGTGTGKTLAYLLAAAWQSTSDHDKIIVSTHTHTLQDQILNKDFQLIQSIFPKLKITTLKGRRNYLSLPRFNKLKEKEHLEEHELTAIIKTLIWLNKTETGDLDELNLQNKEITLIDEICASIENTPKSSPEENLDYLEKARLRAENSDIIVVNHALLIQDAISNTQILPQSHFLIVDEAHHLEKTTTDALTFTLFFGRLIKPLENIEEIFEESISKDFGLQIETVPLHQQTRQLRHHFSHQGEKLFNQIHDFVDKYAKTQPGQPINLSLNISLRKSNEWQEINSLIQGFQELQNQFQDLKQKIQKFIARYTPPESSDLSGQIANLDELLIKILDIPQQQDSKIIWMNKGFDDNVSMQVAPLSITEKLKSKLFDYKKSVILTSATLTTFGNFKYFRTELGLDEHFEELKLPSHFNYPEQVKIIIPEDLPEPKENQYLEDCKVVIHQSILNNHGRTLVLFTAKKDLAKIFHDLAPQLKTEGYHLLGQGLSGGRGKILSHFQDEPSKCAILGTNSFWEGVDLAGDMLTCVIIQKLPFDPPDDPIIQARSQKFRDPFQDYALPRAILRFKQGFGRLIRGASDTGSVIILDSRLIQKKYGQDFILSLPDGIKIEQCSKINVAKLI